MTIEIKLPDIGSDEVEVTEILVKVGDKVEADQSLLTVEGDKASMEIPAPQAGIVKSIIVKIGDKVTTGVSIMEFDDSGTEAVADKQQTTAPVAAPSAPSASQVVDVNVPDIGGDEVEVTEILVKVGDSVSVDDSLITVEGDKASMEVPATIAGVVKSISVKIGDKVKTGSKIMEFETVASSAPVKTDVAPVAAEKPAIATPVANTNNNSAAPAASANTNEFVENAAYAHATPSVRRLAYYRGLKLILVNLVKLNHYH